MCVYIYIYIYILKRHNIRHKYVLCIVHLSMHKPHTCSYKNSKMKIHI